MLTDGDNALAAQRPLTQSSIVDHSNTIVALSDFIKLLQNWETYDKGLLKSVPNTRLIQDSRLFQSLLNRSQPSSSSSHGTRSNSPSFIDLETLLSLRLG